MRNVRHAYPGFGAEVVKLPYPGDHVLRAFAKAGVVMEDEDGLDRVVRDVLKVKHHLVSDGARAFTVTLPFGGVHSHGKAEGLSDKASNTIRALSPTMDEDRTFGEFGKMFTNEKGVCPITRAGHEYLHARSYTVRGVVVGHACR